MGRTLEILPFGLLPIFFFIGYMLWCRASDSAEKNITSKIRHGITELPHDISWLLNRYGMEDVVFTEDGKSVVVTLNGARRWHIVDEASVRENILAKIPSASRDELDPELLARHVITSMTLDAEQDVARIVITLPDDIVRSESYIEREVMNVGRVFARNISNDVRWLQYAQGERRLERRDGRLLVHIDRSQIAPGFLDTKQVTMSERQITRNIKSRLWNRVDVRCVSMSDKTYCGEILIS